MDCEWCTVVTLSSALAFDRDQGSPEEIRFSPPGPALSSAGQGCPTPLPWVLLSFNPLFPSWCCCRTLQAPGDVHGWEAGPCGDFLMVGLEHPAASLVSEHVLIVCLKECGEIPPKRMIPAELWEPQVIQDPHLDPGLSQLPPTLRESPAQLFSVALCTPTTEKIWEKKTKIIRANCNPGWLFLDFIRISYPTQAKVFLSKAFQ